MEESNMVAGRSSSLEITNQEMMPEEVDLKNDFLRTHLGLVRQERQELWIPSIAKYLQPSSRVACRVDSTSHDGDTSTPSDGSPSDAGSGLGTTNVAKESTKPISNKSTAGPPWPTRSQINAQQRVMSELNFTCDKYRERLQREWSHFQLPPSIVVASTAHLDRVAAKFKPIFPFEITLGIETDEETETKTKVRDRQRDRSRRVPPSQRAGRGGGGRATATSQRASADLVVPTDKDLLTTRVTRAARANAGRYAPERLPWSSGPRAVTRRHRYERRCTLVSGLDLASRRLLASCDTLTVSLDRLPYTPLINVTPMSSCCSSARSSPVPPAAVTQPTMPLSVNDIAILNTILEDQENSRASSRLALTHDGIVDQEGDFQDFSSTHGPGEMGEVDFEQLLTQLNREIYAQDPASSDSVAREIQTQIQLDDRDGYPTLRLSGSDDGGLESTQELLDDHHHMSYTGSEQLTSVAT